MLFDLVVARRRFMVGQFLQRVVNLVQFVKRRRVAPPAGVIVKTCRAQQSQGQDAANHKQQVSLDPDHITDFNGFCGATMMLNVNVLLASTGEICGEDCTDLGSNTGLAFNSRSTA